MTQTDAGVDVAPSRSSNYRPHLDGLRAVAVYLVVAFHARLAGFAGGFIGVDVFFVLSGYLVTSILLRDLGTGGRVDLRRFYARRFRRILPAAAVALLVTAVAYAIVATPAQMLDALGGFRAAFLYVANWHFISQATDYFAPRCRRARCCTSGRSRSRSSSTSCGRCCSAGCTSRASTAGEPPPAATASRRSAGGCSGRSWPRPRWRR